MTNGWPKHARKKATKKKGRGKKASRKGGAGASVGQRSSGALIISKTRVKAATSLNVAADFYLELDRHVQDLIFAAEQRAESNGRSTLRPCDL